jgi:hypothetical protein
MQYEIDTLNSNLNYDNKEVNIIMKEHNDQTGVALGSI